MLLETVLEEEPLVFSKETMHVNNIPVVNLDQFGNPTIRYQLKEFLILEFCGESYKNAECPDYFKGYIIINLHYKNQINIWKN